MFTDRYRIAFPLIGGKHQVFHTMPVACSLSLSRSNAAVYALVPDEEVLEVAEMVASEYPGSFIRFRQLRRSSVADFSARVAGRVSLAKRPILRRNRALLNSFDALVVPECTSIHGRRVGINNPSYICIPHGAGDRAVSFESRFRLFDRVLVAGPKTASRMIQSGVQEDRVRMIGYPKAALIDRKGAPRPQLFDNDRPIVLYNPHFVRRLSSLDRGLEIARQLVRDGRFNLIIAPHIRSFENASTEHLARWHSLTVPGKVVVDTGTNRLIDMTYTRVADIYLGDVSSQVYEFLLRPRPCVFINSHGVHWEGNADYDFWRLGEVVGPGEVGLALGRAAVQHGRFLRAQRAATAATFGNGKAACNLAVEEIISCVDERRQSAAALNEAGRSNWPSPELAHI